MAESKDDKTEAEIMRDMNETLKRMHKTPPKPHKEQKATEGKRRPARPKAEK
jgi:hypothetical protein